MEELAQLRFPIIFIIDCKLVMFLISAWGGSIGKQLRSQTLQLERRAFKSYLLHYLS